ncbi:MAG TPA: nucleotidyltransferase domain-containing protein [Aliidongia sp.]|nr:nucleotidyltransferase domain-containing protein [Aliidongia sp.]
MSLPLSLDLALQLAQRYCAERYPEAGALLAGSVVRGLATPTSDLDIVLIFDRLDNAWRETTAINGIVTELFAHDAGTLAWFFDLDAREGSAALATMVAEGIPVGGPNALIDDAKSLAAAALAHGPPSLDLHAIEDRRYRVTDLADDLRGGGTPSEIMAIAARLHEELAQLMLRADGRWAGKGKALARQLEAMDADLALRFEHAFGALFRHGHAAQLLGLVEELLAPLGGPAAAGYRREAPADWRKG